MLFDMSLDTLANGEMKETQPLLAELKKLIADKPDAPGVFAVTRKAAIVLQQLGRREAALEAYQTIGGAYKDSQDTQLATEARAMLDMAKAQTLEVKLDLDGKLRAMLTGQPNSAPPVLEVLKALLGIEAPGEYVLNVAAQVAQLMEISGNLKEAGEAFTLLENAFKNSPDKELAEQAAARAENGRRRAALIGQPFAVDGTQVDGSPFDWGRYQGKVVLVDFWATWCEPCLREMPNLKQSYEKYRDQGFEVVGVNIDDDPQMVKRFLALQPLPWTTVISADSNARGFDHPLAVKCGIDAIPFLVLIGRDGKVNALHVGGEKLDQKLAQLLGSAAHRRFPRTRDTRRAADSARQACGARCGQLSQVVLAGESSRNAEARLFRKSRASSPARDASSFYLGTRAQVLRAPRAKTLNPTTRHSTWAARNWSAERPAAGGPPLVSRPTTNPGRRRRRC